MLNKQKQNKFSFTYQLIQWKTRLLDKGRKLFRRKTSQEKLQQAMKAAELREQIEQLRIKEASLGLQRLSFRNPP